MKQYDAVAIISDAIIKEGLVQAIFLKGSFARETEDEYSNVDLYCVLKSENINSFEKRISNYLKKYGPVIYFNKLNSKIVCIFENDVLINLHYLEINKIIFED